jgi:hypothetical protein
MTLGLGPLERSDIVENLLDGVVLLGWKTRDAALDILQNSCHFDPTLTDAAAEALWAEYRGRVNERRGREIRVPERLSFTSDEQRLVDRYRDTMKASGITIGDVVKVDPVGLVVHQLEITTALSGATARRLRTPSDWTLEFLAPTTPLTRPPNVNHAPNAIDLELPHGEWLLTFDPVRGFLVTEGGRHVGVVTMNSRLALWSGYHRTYASVVHARPREPGILAVVEDEALPAAAPRTCGQRAAVSDNPPVFDDFFNPDLALRVQFRRKRFTLQVRARMVVTNETAGENLHAQL